MRKFAVILLFGFATIPFSLAQNANVWVDTNGGTCTRQSTPGPYVDAQACSSFSAAYNAAQGGDVVYVKAGTYGAQTIPSRSLGTSYVTISAEPGVTVNTGGISVNTNYVIVNGFNVGNAQVWVQATGTGSYPNGTCTRHHVTVSNNIAAGPLATIGGGCDNLTFIGNDVSGTDHCADPNNVEDAMQIVSFGNWGTYIPSNITVKNNYIHDMVQNTCGGHDDGIQLAGCSNCTIDGNRFNNTDTSQIILYAPSTGETDAIVNVKIQNNAFGNVLAPGHGVSVGGNGCSTDLPNNVLLYNNVFYGNVTMDINCSGNHVAGTMRGNYVVAAGQECYGNPAVFDMVMDYNVFGSGGCGSHIKNCSPSFVSPSHASGNVDLSASDICLKDYVPAVAGTFPSTDIHGTTRPQGAAVDAGADEYVQSGGTQPSPPPSPAPNAPSGLQALVQ